jgi:hypothetical protein
MKRFSTFTVIVFSIVNSFCCPAQTIAQEAPDAEAVANAIKSVQSVSLNGVGHPEAVQAMQVLNRISVDQLPLLFEAMEGCNKLSANWIRAAAQKAIGKADAVPVAELTAYFNDQSGDPLGRWLAYQVIVENEAGFREKTIDALAMDPSLPLREIGIEHLLEQARAIEVNDGDDDAKAKKMAILNSAFEHALDVGQIQEIAKLSSKLGKEINLREHLGFLPTWKLIAGFDNKDESGFDVVYGPEKDLENIDTSKGYSVDEETVDWIETTTDHETGIVNLNELIGKKKGVIGYAVGTFESPIEGPAEIRIGTWNAHKIWINGTLFMSNEIYHNSSSIDKFSAPISLKKGENEIVIKLCQNEQTQPWAQEWSFQVRICDASGKAIK